MLLLPDVKLAAPPEVVIIFAVIYFIAAMISKIQKAANKKNRPAEQEPTPTQPAETSSSQSPFSLESVLKEIERVKQEAERRQAPAPKPQPVQLPRKAPVVRPSQPRAAGGNDRGPMGRRSSSRLPSSEEFEDRTSLEDGGSIEGPGRLKEIDETRRRRVVVDQDEGAEAVIQRRLREAESRNRQFSESDHREFHEKVKATADPVQAARPLGLTPGQLKTAFVWKEILGPPRSEEL